VSIKFLRPWSGTERLLLTVLAALLASSLSGCGKKLPKTIKVGGKVTYQGAPVPTGTITFHPTERTGKRLYRPAVDVLEADGTYELQSFRHGDGAMPGEYAVAIESFEGGPTDEFPLRPREWVIPQSFANPATSGLSASIPSDASGRLEIDFNL